MTARMHRKHAEDVCVLKKLQSTEGASIVIALIFFLICAVVGSIVLTAASINAKAVVTHQETQQASYAVSSAAQLVVKELTPASIVWTKSDAGAMVPQALPTPALANQIWKNHCDAIWAIRNPTLSTSPTSYIISGLQINVTGQAALNVDANIEIDRDFNIVVRLTSPGSGYSAVVSSQCVPTYDLKGELVATAWPTAVIESTNPAGGSS